MTLVPLSVVFAIRTVQVEEDRSPVLARLNALFVPCRRHFIVHFGVNRPRALASIGAEVAILFINWALFFGEISSPLVRSASTTTKLTVVVSAAGRWGHRPDFVSRRRVSKQGVRTGSTVRPRKSPRRVGLGHVGLAERTSVYGRRRRHPRSNLV